jgi:hypothetical protein
MRSSRRAKTDAVTADRQTSIGATAPTKRSSAAEPAIRLVHPKRRPRACPCARPRFANPGTARIEAAFPCRPELCGYPCEARHVSRSSSKCCRLARRACSRGIGPRDADWTAAPPHGARSPRCWRAGALVFGAIFSMGIAMMIVARVPHTADMAKSADANLPMERTLIIPGNK